MPNWNEISNEIHQLQAQSQAKAQQAIADGQQAINTTRRKYILELHHHTQRNVIAYYSGWLSKSGGLPFDINDEDKTGFMTAIHGMDCSQGLDLILHTPGGGIAATQSIVNYLHKKFGNNIRAFVPQIAMSAGTIMACCCQEIWMGKHSNLGPIDPHLRDIPAYGVLEEFKQAIDEVKKDPKKILVWQQIISQYRPTFLSQCKNAIDWSNAFVEEQLAAGMFASLADRKKKAKAVAKELSKYSKNKSHSKHLHAEECKKMGLVIKDLEDDQTLQGLVLTVHHCYMLTLMNTSAFKMIENHNGIALVKNMAVPQPSQQQSPKGDQTI